MVVNRPVTIKTPIKTSRVPAARPSGTIHRFTRSVPAKNQLNATAANTKGIPSPRAYNFHTFSQPGNVRAGYVILHFLCNNIY